MFRLFIALHCQKHPLLILMKVSCAVIRFIVSHISTELSELASISVLVLILNDSCQNLMK